VSSAFSLLLRWAAVTLIHNTKTRARTQTHTHKHTPMVLCNTHHLVLPHTHTPILLLLSHTHMNNTPMLLDSLVRVWRACRACRMACMVARRPVVRSPGLLRRRCAPGARAPARPWRSRTRTSDCPCGRGPKLIRQAVNITRTMVIIVVFLGQLFAGMIFWRRTPPKTLQQ
jgi:hypothetical protein